MVAYVTVDQVASEFKDITFNSTSAVKDTEVTEIIEQESAYVQSFLDPIYELPIAGADALTVLKKITTALVAFRVADILSMARSIKVSDSAVIQEIKGGTAYKAAKRDLELISKEKLVLSGATLKSNRDPSSYNSANCVDPVFSTTEQQW